MKGAAAGGNAVFVDISHDVPRHDIRVGAYLLWSAAPAFPPGTVHCAVVDPGVGGARAALAVASGGHLFVGPDNGLLMPAARRLGTPRIFRLVASPGGGAVVSSTFHGRDVFAPAAARLAAGEPVESIGRPVDDVVDLAFSTGRRHGRRLEGEVLWVDPFGNLITTIPGELLADMPARGAVEVQVGGGSITAAIGTTFGDVPRGQAVAYVGSDGVVEIAINQGSAAAATGAGAGARVRIAPV
jgi:S-adenosyl-L-methionine hydrolase (adenosine-forming)